MADTTDTPTTIDTDAPATPRRRGPRKNAEAKPTTTRRAPRKSTIEKAEDAVTSTAAGATTRVKRGAAKAEEAVGSAIKAVKPKATTRAKSRPAAKTGTTARKSSAKSKGGSKWGVAAVAGGLAAAGAAAAALLSLKSSSKGSTPAPAKPSEGAHQPDGNDSSKSFEAGIADENTVPN